MVSEPVVVVVTGSVVVVASSWEGSSVVVRGVCSFGFMFFLFVLITLGSV